MLRTLVTRSREQKGWADMFSFSNSANEVVVSGRRLPDFSVSSVGVHTAHIITVHANCKGTNGVDIVSDGETLGNAEQSYGAGMVEQRRNSIRSESCADVDDPDLSISLSTFINTLADAAAGLLK